MPCISMSMARADSLKLPYPPTAKKVSPVQGADDRLEGLPLVIDHHIFVRSVRWRASLRLSASLCYILPRRHERRCVRVRYSFFPNQPIVSKGARDGSSTHLHHRWSFSSAGLINPHSCLFYIKWSPRVWKSPNEEVARGHG